MTLFSPKKCRGYDYSQAGAYFVTICTQNRKCLFGDVVDREMGLNEMGNIVANEWIKTAAIHHEIELDEWIVMPNHFHGIVVITGTTRRAPAFANHHKNMAQRNGWYE